MFSGYQSGWTNLGSDNNVFVGAQADYANRPGNRSTALGAGAGVSAAGLSGTALRPAT